jgi:hypothetical protein
MAWRLDQWARAVEALPAHLDFIGQSSPRHVHPEFIGEVLDVHRLAVRIFSR